MEFALVVGVYADVVGREDEDERLKDSSYLVTVPLLHAIPITMYHLIT
jgi:hypothetical protein